MVMRAWARSPIWTAVCRPQSSSLQSDSVSTAKHCSGERSLGFLFSIIALLYLQLHISSTVCRERFSTKTMKSFKFIGKYQVSSKGHFLRRVFPPRIFRQLLCSISVVGVLHAVITHYPRPLYKLQWKRLWGVVKVQKANRQAVEPHAMSIRFIYRDGTSWILQIPIFYSQTDTKKQLRRYM